MRRPLLLVAVVSITVAASGVLEGRQQAQSQTQSQGRGGQQPQQPTRDQTTVTPATGTISGRVLTADSGHPIKRARVVASGTGRGGRSTITDEVGRYELTELPAGTYTISATKTGFVDGIFGQRRPLQAGTPLDLADGQQVANIDVKLVRGGVITGRIADEDGEPLARARVTVQRYQYLRGERQLTAAGTDDSDDRGQYRVYGLPPGEYFISAIATDSGQGVGRGMAAFGAAGGGRGGRGGFGATEDPEPTGYAPTYYPGVMSAPEAGKITVGPGQEVSGIDFQVQLVSFVTIRGIVGGGGDNAATVMLVPQDGAGGAIVGAQVLRGRSQPGGGFVITNVPPGHYLAVARAFTQSGRRGGGGGDPLTAIQPIVVTGENINNLALVLMPGVAMSGNITVESSGTPAPTDYSTFRVDVPEANPLPMAAGPGGRGGLMGPTAGRADQNGTFEIGNLLPGAHYLRVTGQGPWGLKSVSVGGEDVTDRPFELKSGQNVGDVTIVMTDRATSINGTVLDGVGNGIEGLTVIAFSSDSQYWRPQSRQIQTSQTDSSGAYHLHGLPPGEYQIIALDDVDPGEWYDPSFLDPLRQRAKTIRLAEGDTQTIDLAGPG